jgi:uncharacterized protein
MNSELRKNIEIIQQNFEHIKNTYGVKKIAVFGSVARGEAKKNSDVDIIVEFSKPIGFFAFVELEFYLSNLLGKDVDLVTKKALKPLIKKSVLKEAVYA